MRIHELKIESPSFLDIKDGRKTYEIRSIADRSFRVGDAVLLREITTQDSAMVRTGSVLLVEITHVTAGGDYGLPRDLCVFGVKPAITVLPIRRGIPATIDERAAPISGDLDF